MHSCLWCPLEHLLAQFEYIHHRDPNPGLHFYFWIIRIHCFHFVDFFFFCFVCLFWLKIVDGVSVFTFFVTQLGCGSNCCGSIIYSTFLSGLGTAFIQFSQEKFPLETWTFKKISPPIPIELEPPEYEHQICLSLKLPTGS